MKIKILWGFVGNGVLLGADSNKVMAGTVFEAVDDEYGHALIGKGLAVEIGADDKSRAAAPEEDRPAGLTDEAAAAEKVAAEKAAAEKEAADKAVAEKTAADKVAAEKTTAKGK